MQNDITDNANDAVAAAAQAAAEQRVQTIDEQLGNITKKVAEKIKACDNILVALSNNPSVDEISAAIGLTMVLNEIGKHVTAIYSGETPNTLEFLNPSETFEKDTNSLQDFIIALSKDKADHLRYSIEGDYVKVYITPYKTTISEKDLEFSQGDFNVDLVIAINVDSAEVLDAALEEYGRIMHDATAINITTSQAGHFAELEWSDPSISSVCEMIVDLCEYLDVNRFDQPTATAFLTGIVSATERFSNARTTSETMQISSRLMQYGADQQLISSNIMQPAPAPEPEPEPEPESEPEPAPTPAVAPEPLIPAPTLAPFPGIATEPVAPVAPEPVAPVAPEPVAPVPEAPIPAPESMTPEPMAPAPAPEPGPVIPETPAAEPEILVGVPAPEKPAPAPSIEPAGPEGLAAPTAITPEPIQQAAPAPAPAPEVPSSDTFALPQIISQGSVMNQNVAEPIPETPDYGAMIDQALTEANAAPVAPASPIMSAPAAPIAPTAPINPAVQAAPIVPTQVPEAASVPNIEVIPAAPAPVPEPAAPAAPIEPAPVAQPVPEPQPSAFPVQSPVVSMEPEAPVQPIEVPQADIELPPPPIPVIDPNGGLPPVVAEAPDPMMPPAQPAMPEVPQPAPVEPQPAPAPEAPATPLADPSAFQIPQM